MVQPAAPRRRTLIAFCTLLVLSAHAQISCTPTRFYGHGSDRNIYGLTLSGNTVTLGDAVEEPGSSGLGLSVADLGDGNAFYTANFNGNGSIAQLIDGTWQDILTDSIIRINSGGNGGYLYFQSIRNGTGTLRNRIERFDGTTPTVIWDDSTTYQTVSDLAVDDSGRVYFFTGDSLFYTKQLNIMSPTGDMLSTIPVVFNSSNAYGCFLVDSTIYVGIGPSNSFFPSSLLPIHVANGVATIGTPMDVEEPAIGTTPNGSVYLYLVDLASCASSGITLSTGAALNGLDIDIGFNPWNNLLSVSWSGSAQAIITVMDALGRPVAVARSSATISTIDMGTCASGVYIVNVSGNGISTARRIVKP